MIPPVLDSPTPQIVSADGTRIWAAQAGRPASEAPAIVFVPGYAFPSLVFERQFQDTQLLARFCLITYEPRGQGRSAVVPDTADPWRADLVAQDFEAVCAHYGATRVVLAGWSYGCITACDVFAHGLGARIAGLVCIAGLPCKQDFGACFSPLTQNYSPRMSTAALTDLDSAGPLLTGFVTSCFHPSRRADLPYTFTTAMMGSIAQTPATQRAKEFTTRTQDPAQLLAAAGTVETLLVLGSDDEVVRGDVIADYYARHFGRVQSVTFSEAGHAPFWEKPDEFRAVLSDFVERVS